MPLVPEVI